MMSMYIYIMIYIYTQTTNRQLVITDRGRGVYDELFSSWDWSPLMIGFLLMIERV